ncbi:MAG: DUF3880 domain-containing protein, partial [Lachnospiraceae bacterium]|nr:DUF3880 domain-containing protein [Lachnospiraceae bacterium]
MKILYYHWMENACSDCVASMREQGHDVEIYSEKMENYTRDPAFLEKITRKLREGYDGIFSFNYFPLLSEAAQEAEIIYFCWVYDSPNLTLESETLNNPCNRVCLFDYGLYENYRRKGFETVDYLPLPCAVHRLDQLLASERGYRYDMSFVGRLYDDSYNFYRQIGYLPEDMR